MQIITLTVDTFTRFLYLEYISNFRVLKWVSWVLGEKIRSPSLFDSNLRRVGKSLHIMRKQRRLGLAKYRHRYYSRQCWGSETFWRGSGSPDPFLGLMDPDSDPDHTPDLTTFFNDFKDLIIKKILIFFSYPQVHHLQS
jgi:hypothetical protein